MNTKHCMIREIHRTVQPDCITIRGLFDMGDYDELGVVQLDDKQRVIFEHYLGEDND